MIEVLALVLYLKLGRGTLWFKSIGTSTESLSYTKDTENINLPKFSSKNNNTLKKKIKEKIEKLNDSTR